jgi:hypothetical protein
MAVNENLYSWLLKTQGMPAAEWYRSNPTKPHTSNPHVPLGAAKWFPQASTGGSGNTYASTGSDIQEVSVTEPASRSDYFQQFLNSLSPDQRAEIEEFGNISEEDKKEIGYDYAARQQLTFGTPLAEGEYAAAGGLYYTPTFGEYGGYLTKQNPDTESVARVRDMMARQAAGTADPSWANQNLSGLISTSGLGGWHVRGATENDPEVQKYGIYNVGRSDYMQTRRNEALQKNIEILKQQASQGIQPSQEFLEEYIAEGGEGTQADPQYGPRGEELGDVASILPPAMTQGDLYRAIRDRGSSSPGTKEYGELRDLQKEWIQRQQKLKGAEAPQENQSVDVRVARAAEKSDVQRERLAQQSEFDISKEKQLASAKAADAYRRSAAVEDPFRAAARVG